MKMLNLGAGSDYREGWVNHDHPDARRSIPAERTCDLNVYPWACFEDNEFDVVEANHIIEHLGDVVKTMNELTRIIKPGGKLIVRVPHCSRAWCHPMHKTPFSAGWYDILVCEGYLEPGLLEKVGEKLNWERVNRKSPQKLRVPLKLINAVLNPAANAWPLLMERVWWAWVGGFSEVEVVFVKPEVVRND